MNSMVVQQKIEKLLREQAGDSQGDANAESAASASADTAAGLVDALDNLLLERAVQEHREALTRLNKLKLALDQKSRDS
jgi:hypothetical protein